MRTTESQRLRLASLYPNVDVLQLAAWVDSRPGVTAPDSLLASLCRTKAAERPADYRPASRQHEPVGHAHPEVAERELDRIRQLIGETSTAQRKPYGAVLGRNSHRWLAWWTDTNGSRILGDFHASESDAITQAESATEGP